MTETVTVPTEMPAEPYLVIYGTGLCYASVCTNVPDDEATSKLNASHPTGVSPWAISAESFAAGEPNPTPCPDRSDCRHILFDC